MNCSMSMATVTEMSWDWLSVSWTGVMSFVCFLCDVTNKATQIEPKVSEYVNNISVDFHLRQALKERRLFLNTEPKPRTLGDKKCMRNTFLLESILPSCSSQPGVSINDYNTKHQPLIQSEIISLLRLKKSRRRFCTTFVSCLRLRQALY